MALVQIKVTCARRVHLGHNRCTPQQGVRPKEKFMYLVLNPVYYLGPVNDTRVSWKVISKLEAYNEIEAIEMAKNQGIPHPVVCNEKDYCAS